jgi:hypothetical protein
MFGQRSSRCVLYLIYLLTSIWLTPGGSNTVHIYTQTIHRIIQCDRLYRTYITIRIHKHNNSRSQWPRGQRRVFAAVRLQRLSVRIPRAAWMFVCFECRVLSDRGLCDELITRPDESYQLCCVVVCDLKTS